MEILVYGADDSLVPAIERCARGHRDHVQREPDLQALTHGISANFVIVLRPGDRTGWSLLVLRAVKPEEELGSARVLVVAEDAADLHAASDHFVAAGCEVIQHLGNAEVLLEPLDVEFIAFVHVSDGVLEVTRLQVVRTEATPITLGPIVDLFRDE